VVRNVFVEFFSNRVKLFVAEGYLFVVHFVNLKLQVHPFWDRQRDLEVDLRFFGGIGVGKLQGRMVVWPMGT
jgi:hypothetical protein